MGQEGKGALKKFKAFWTDYKAKANELPHDNKIHPEDLAAIPENHRITIDSNTKKSDIEGGRIITNERPDPCCGDIKNAKLIILSLNPGFGTEDFNAECYLNQKEKEQHNPAKTQNPNLNKKSFNYLYDDEKHKGAYDYWHSTFKTMVKEYAEELKIKNSAALDEIANATCLLESLCYASNSSPSINKNKIESSKLIKEVVQSYLLPKAKAGKILIFSWRQSTFWGIEEHKGDNVIISQNPQSGDFGKGEKDAMRKFLIEKRQLWPCIISSLKTRLCRS